MITYIDFAVETTVVCTLIGVMLYHIVNARPPRWIDVPLRWLRARLIQLCKVFGVVLGLAAAWAMLSFFMTKDF